MSTTNIAPVSTARKSSPSTPRRRAATSTAPHALRALGGLADRLHAAVQGLTAALEAGDLAAARVARDAVNRARIELDVAAVGGAA